MAVMKEERQQFVTCWLKTSSVIWLLCWFQEGFTYGDVYVVLEITAYFITFEFSV